MATCVCIASTAATCEFSPTTGNLTPGAETECSRKQRPTPRPPGRPPCCRWALPGPAPNRAWAPACPRSSILSRVSATPPPWMCAASPAMASPTVRYRRWGPSHAGRSPTNTTSTDQCRIGRPGVPSTHPPRGESPSWVCWRTLVRDTMRPYPRAWRWHTETPARPDSLYSVRIYIDRIILIKQYRCYLTRWTLKKSKFTNHRCVSARLHT